MPGGWRWESFGGVQVGVPGDWGWGTGDQRPGQWCDRLTITLNGVVVAIQAEERLREQVASTIHRVDVDSHGCPATHPLTDLASRRPPDPVEVGSLTGVTAVSACKYPLRLAAVAKAPDGGGPDRPSSCLAEFSYGDEAIVLS